ncbi:MAG: hypothetical protein LBB74_05950 [Chitinispirillales bacterium]|jgi:hypothetical protein|nr:hypothetical protein [Chitinispirillales bacterium]
MLFVGFLAGGGAASVVWALVVFGRRRAVDAQRAEKEQLMASVGETLSEADAIETNFRSGALAPEAFRRNMGDRINAVMRLLRTNMHILDAYFVKYAEQEARDYLRVIDNPERRKNDGPDFPAAPIPGAVDKAAMYEQPFAVPAPEPIAIVTPAHYELPPAAPAAPVADAAGTVDDFEPLPSAPEPVAIVTPARYELPPAAPAPIIAGAAAPDDDFEPPPPAPAPSVIDTDEPPPPAPAPIAGAGVADTDDDFEPPHISATETATLYGTPQGAPVREEELVLGESPEDRNAAFTYGSAPAPTGASSFAPPPQPPVMPPPAPLPAGDAAWSGGDSIEEFEAAFEQFEIPASQPPAAEYEETGRFPMGDVFESPSPGTQAFAPEMPPPPPQSRQGDDHEFTETSSIDRGAILNAMAASGQTPPPVQTPLSVQMPPIPMPAPQADHHEHQGITGDDVVDSIDSFFKLN